MRHLLDFLKNNKGATAIEYGLLIMLIAILLIATLFFVGQSIVAMFDEVISGFAAS